MTGTRIAEIMREPTLGAHLRKLARRYTACIEDQEEYVQEAWLRIARECEDDDPHNMLAREGRMGIENAYRRKKYRVEKKLAGNLHSIGEGIPRNAIDLHRGRWLDPEPIRLDPWYYGGQWLDYGLDSAGITIRSWYRIIVEET